jgi:hypothetical protein
MNKLQGVIYAPPRRRPYKRRSRSIEGASRSSDSLWGPSSSIFDKTYLVKTPLEFKIYTCKMRVE